MPVFRIEVHATTQESDARLVSAADGIAAVTACRTTRLFFLETSDTERIAQADIEKIAAPLLCDPITETYTIGASPVSVSTVEVTFFPGVTDPVAENLVRVAKLAGIPLTRAATGTRYEVDGQVTHASLRRLAVEVFSNPIIQRHVLNETISAPFIAYQQADDTVETIPLCKADDAGLMALSRDRRLSLDLHEMRAIRDYFEGEGREPTDAELEMLAQTWSEHCVHKTFKAQVTYTGPAHGASPHSAATEQHINGLLRTYIRAATEQLAKPWVYSAFVDNAGIVRFDDTWDLAFKVETHNRPSALEPFGGASTGVGGVIRDVLGVSARPIANTDVLCFGLPNAANPPENVLHPRRIAQGVIAGIEDYGNKMGIPTVNGAIHYHPGYTANPLVFCGCLGLLPHGAHRTTAQAGDLIVVIGGHTGRDGLRGATFSSMELDSTSSSVSSGAVQIGNPIIEKQVQEAVLRARDAGLYTAITDCGAGGLSSAVGEMGAEIGAEVFLERVPLKYPGLRPWEIWLSEAQERMVLAVPPQHWEAVQQICASQDIQAVAIGTFEPTGRLTLRYNSKLVGDVAMAFLHDGLPQRKLEAVWSAPTPVVTPRPAVEDLAHTLLGLLALPTIRSKEDIIRRYDHEVQGGTAVRPMVGVDAAGPGDAAVIVPQHTPQPGQPVRGAALSNGLCPTYGELDPYAMAWAAVDEALRNCVAVGADPDYIAILDNFCWGNTNLPDRMGALVRCAQGCYDAALAYGVPFISGKDSLNNEYVGEDGQRHAIPGTLVISALGIVPDVTQTATSDFKTPGNLLYLVGNTRDEFGGSHYHLLHGLRGGTVPQPNPNPLETLRAVHKAIQAGSVSACHDVSEGGLAVALAEMAIGGRLGADITLPQGDAAIWLYAESTGRFVMEVTPQHRTQFESLVPSAAWIGTVTEAPVLHIAQSGQTRLMLEIATLEQAWRGHGGTQAAVAPAPRQQTSESEALSVPFLHTARPRVLILHANGSNRDHDAFLACELAGGAPEIVHVNQIFSGQRALLDYHMLVIPGGFSYGDDLGAGVLWAFDLRERLTGLDQFVADGRPVLGICNGFQTLVKAELLPGRAWNDPRRVTLTYNAQRHFECRWVYLEPNPASPCVFTQGLTERIHCPVAHGEGRIAASDETTLADLHRNHLIPLTYCAADGQPAGYPFNPNGSAHNIAALCNPAGNVFGLMPHPENHIYPWQHPRRHRGESGMMGLALFQNGVRHAVGRRSAERSR